MNSSLIVAAIQPGVECIVDHLVAKGHMDPLRREVCQEILSDQVVSVNEARKLLDWLLRQSSKVFW